LLCATGVTGDNPIPVTPLTHRFPNPSHPQPSGQWRRAPLPI